MPPYLDLAWPLSVLLLSLRLGAMLLMTPVLQAMNTPPMVRVLLVLALSALLITAFPASRMPMSADGLGGTGGAKVFQAALNELVLGGALGLGITLAFAAFSVAGRLLDLQIGYSIGQALDPVSRAQSTVLTSLFGMVGVLLFFVTNGHHTLVRAFAAILERYPVGQALPGPAAAAALIGQAAGMFTLGLALVAPVVLALLLLDCGLAMVARSLPQINMFLMSIPVKVLVGLGTLGMWMGSSGGQAGRIHASTLHYWEGLFR